MVRSAYALYVAVGIIGVVGGGVVSSGRRKAHGRGEPYMYCSRFGTELNPPGRSMHQSHMS